MLATGLTWIQSWNEIDIEGNQLIEMLQNGNNSVGVRPSLSSDMKNVSLGKWFARMTARSLAGIMILQVFWSGIAEESIPPKIEEASLGVAELLARGSLADENGDATKALNYYREAVGQFDQGRPMMAEALFRVGESYRALGAEESAAVAFRRIVREFSDVTDVFEKVDATFKEAANLLPGKIETKGAVSESITTPVNINEGSDKAKRLDPKYEERRLLLEGLQRRVERARQRMEVAEDQLVDLSERLQVVRDSSVFTIPEEARPEDLMYRELKTAWGQAFRGDRSKQNEIELEQLQQRADEWVQSFFIPSLRAAIEAARRKFEERSVLYDTEVHQYKDWLKELQAQDRKADLERKEQVKSVGSFSIIGKVRVPQVYEIKGSRPMSLQHAVALAGGLAEAARDSVVVYRDGVAHRITLREQLKLREKDQFHIKDGDVIDVPERFF